VDWRRTKLGRYVRSYRCAGTVREKCRYTQYDQWEIYSMILGSNLAVHSHSHSHSYDHRLRSVYLMPVLERYNNEHQPKTNQQQSITVNNQQPTTNNPTTTTTNEPSPVAIKRSPKPHQYSASTLTNTTAAVKQQLDNATFH
jgi:hypothetical protein